MYQYEIILAGFGGQGILSAGRLLAYAGMLEGRNVSWLPSYGPEMRGGTANCHVIISEDQVASPILKKANALIIMNGPSLDKFEKMISDDGVMVVDSSLVARRASLPEGSKAKVCSLPATQMASDMGNTTYANIIMLGKLVDETGMISRQSFEKALYSVLPPKYHHMIPEEIKAFEAGAAYKENDAK